MKCIVIVILSVITINAYPQSKHVAMYEAEFITDELIQNFSLYDSKDEKIIHNRVEGTDVIINVDTIFKKYLISYLDQNGKRIGMELIYDRDVYPESNSQATLFNKIYYMTAQGLNFLVTDYMELPPMNYLIIQFVKKYSNNSTLILRIKNVKRNN